MAEEISRSTETVNGDEFEAVYRLNQIKTMTVYEACIQVDDVHIQLFEATIDSPIIASLQHRAMLSKTVRGSKDWAWWFMFLGLEKPDYHILTLEELKEDVRGILAQFGELRRLEKEKDVTVKVEPAPKKRRMKSILAHA